MKKHAVLMIFLIFLPMNVILFSWNRVVGASSSGDAVKNLPPGYPVKIE